MTSDAPNPGASFRDPGAVDEQARAIRRSLARCLVNAPELPVDLPRFGMRLLDVEARQRGVALLLGQPDPVAALVVSKASTNEAGPAVEVSIELVHPGAEQRLPALRTMAERVARYVSRERWTAAEADAKQLRALPVDIPLAFFRQLVAGVTPPVGLVRTGFLCNQDCGMCWQGRDWARHTGDQVRTWIEDLWRAGARGLIVSGGEPTLDRELPAYVAFARELGFRNVTLETNAIRMSQRGYAETLRDAGVTSAFVSLHSAVPEVSDAITRAPGTHAKTVAGVQRLLAAGIELHLNAVLTEQGLATLPLLPDFLADQFGSGVAGLMISFPSDPFEASLADGIVPNPDVLRRVLPQVVARANARGLPLQKLNGPCGPPVCAFGPTPPFALEDIAGPVEFRSYFPACDACSVKRACFGVPQGQAQRYGEASVAPLAAVAGPSP